MSNNLPQEKIKKIQLFFRNCLLRKRINELHELNLHNYDTCSQDEFHKYILDNEEKIVDVCGKILRILRIKILQPKQFIMSFVMIKYPKELFTNFNKDKLQKALYSHSVILHKYLYNQLLIPNTQTLEHLFNIYYILFTYWSKKDKHEILMLVYNMYYERIDKFESDTNDSITIDMFYEVQVETLHYIKSLSEKNGLTDLAKYKPIYEKLRANTFKKMRNIMEKAFWDILKDDLDSSPPKFDRVVIILEDIKTQLLKLVEKSKKEVEQINDILDIQYIGNRITNGTFDNKLLNTLIFFIIEKIREYGAPVNDKSVLDWGKNIKNTLESSPDLTYGKLLPPLFKEMMNRIMHIHGAVKIIREKNIANNLKQ